MAPSDRASLPEELREGMPPKHLQQKEIDAKHNRPGELSAKGYTNYDIKRNEERLEGNQS